MSGSMQQRALRREPVLLPDAFDVNERTLALAEHEMLQTRKRQIVVVLHSGAANSDQLEQLYLPREPLLLDQNAVV